MSLKHFCDICEAELDRDYVGHRAVFDAHINGRRWRAEVMIAKDATWNDGDLCLDCVMRIITEGSEIGTGYGSPANAEGMSVLPPMGVHTITVSASDRGSMSVHRSGEVTE